MKKKSVFQLSSIAIVITMLFCVFTDVVHAASKSKMCFGRKLTQRETCDISNLPNLSLFDSSSNSDVYLIKPSLAAPIPDDRTITVVYAYTPTGISEVRAALRLKANSKADPYLAKVVYAFMCKSMEHFVVSAEIFSDSGKLLKTLSVGAKTSVEAGTVLENIRNYSCQAPL